MLEVHGSQRPENCGGINTDNAQAATGAPNPTGGALVQASLAEAVSEEIRKGLTDRVLQANRDTGAASCQCSQST